MTETLGDMKALAKAGYGTNRTGGPFDAWERRDKNGDAVRISYDPDREGGSSEGDPKDANWFVGRYNDGIGFVETSEGKTLADAIRFADVIPSPGTGDAQVHGDTVEEIDAGLAAQAPTP